MKSAFYRDWRDVIVPLAVSILSGMLGVAASRDVFI